MVSYPLSKYAASDPFSLSLVNLKSYGDFKVG